MKSSLRNLKSGMGGWTRATVRGSLAAMLWAGLVVTLNAQTNFYTLLTNGPASNRVNIVFLSEGYTAAQFPQFLVDTTNAANLLLTNQPYAEFGSYFNVYAIAVASAQSGSDHPVSGIFSNTFFSSTFGAADYYMSIPPNAYDANASHGQGRVDALLNSYVPQSDLAILLVNDSAVGGSDGGGKTAIVSRGSLFVFPQYYDILVHETGHVLAKLGDEYSDANPGYPDTEEPNTTRETNRLSIKWNAWISTNTPVPTPPTFQYLDTPGLFEGAHYHTTGWYRPKINCQMRSFGSGIGFCEVCQEAFVLSFYRQVRPVENFTPAATNTTVTSTQALTFTLTVLQPTGHSLAIQWLTNGASVAGATNGSFSILPAALGNGTNTVIGRVTDPTALVRTDTSNLLSQTLTWTLNVSLPQLQLKRPRWLGGGKFAVQVAGIAPQGFVLQGSSNFTVWTPLATNSLVNGVFEYTNQVGGLPARFYRAFTPP